jgi:predicted neuraminidase
VKDKPIILQNGNWLAPTSRETNDEWDAAVDISNDKGVSWNLSAPVPLDRSRITGKGIIQPTLWESQPGKVHMLFRSSEGFVYRSDSEDGGSTWSEAYPTRLPNNNSGIDVAAHESGLLALCYNPVDQDWGKRTPLVIGVSKDGGQSWKSALTLEDEDVYPQRNEKNEFSYPAIVSSTAGFSVAYTWKRERIAYWRIPLEKLS